MCLCEFSDVSDRWGHIACAVCCMDDIDDNDYITAEDMEQHYEDMCGGDLTFMKGECIFVIGGSFWIGLNSSSDISI